MFPPRETSSIAQFLCEIADSSKAPRSQLKVANAAITHVYNTVGVHTSVLDNYFVHRLMDSLVKSGTQVPMQRSKIMPIRPFKELFSSWEVNEKLSLKDLRLKTITTLALTLMLRPSDIAPKSVRFDKETGTSTKVVFSTDNIEFCDTGANIMFHGIKNDTSRTGFSVFLQPIVNSKLDPVKALRDYVNRTKNQRPQDNPVFLSLNPPFKAISACTVANILNDAIKLAGLEGRGFSAKSFRPTGATAAIDMNHDPEMTMQVGRWKTRSIFFEHYVHAKPPVSFSGDILEQHE